MIPGRTAAAALVLGAAAAILWLAVPIPAPGLTARDDFPGGDDADVRPLFSAAALAAAAVHRGSLCRLRAAMRRAAAEDRALRLGVEGGSFVVVGGADGSFPALLARMLRKRPGTLAYGRNVTVVNAGQGAADYSVQLWCLEKVYGMVGGGNPMPDVWLAENLVNSALDAVDPLSHPLAAFYATLAYAPGRSSRGTAAVVAVEAGIAHCLGPPKPDEYCNRRKHGPLAAIARGLGISHVSFLDGLAAGLGLPGAAALQNSTGDAAARIDRIRAKLFMANGTDIHYSHAGNILQAEQLWDVFRDAASPATGALCGARSGAPARDDARFHLGRLSSPALDLYERLAASPPTCNTTLTHGHKPDLVPLASSGFDLRHYTDTAYKSDSKMAPTAVRTDWKMTLTALHAGAWAAFPITLPPGGGEACLVVHGRSDERIDAALEWAGGRTACSFRPTSRGYRAYSAACGCRGGGAEGHAKLNLTAVGTGVQVAGTMAFALRAAG